MKRFLLLALTAGLLSQVAAKADFVLPWNKIEPNYPSRETAMNACERENKKSLEKASTREFIESESS